MAASLHGNINSRHPKRAITRAFRHPRGRRDLAPRLAVHAVLAGLLLVAVLPAAASPVLRAVPGPGSRVLSPESGPGDSGLRTRDPGPPAWSGPTTRQDVEAVA